LLSVVSEGPRLGEYMPRSHRVSVTERFLHELSCVECLLLAVALLRSLRLLLLLLPVVAGEGQGSLVSFSDLEHGVWVVVDCFAVVAEVEVRADAALEPDSYEWVHVAAIAHDTLVHFFSLRLLLLLEIVTDHPLEGLGSERAYLFLEHL